MCISTLYLQLKIFIACSSVIKSGEKNGVTRLSKLFCREETTD